jgi:hypothetical protein
MSDYDLHDSEQLPFKNYPNQGQKLLGHLSGDTCRHGYGLKFMQLTGQTHCAYCDMDMTATYENWLTMALDHVVPNSLCKEWEIPDDWREDASNRVLCCAACNGFANRYVPDGIQRPETLEEFYALRDSIFRKRREIILDKHKTEREFFDSKPWE